MKALDPDVKQVFLVVCNHCGVRRKWNAYHDGQPHACFCNACLSDDVEVSRV
jgi:hypothetical protein